LSHDSMSMNWYRKAANLAQPVEWGASFHIGLWR
jgi:hypothetical protein